MFLRLASLAVLLGTLYTMITCKQKDECDVGEPPQCPQLRVSLMCEPVFKVILYFTKHSRNQGDDIDYVFAK